MLADWRSVEIRGDIWAACEWDTDRGENMCTLHWSTAERPGEKKQHWEIELDVGKKKRKRVHVKKQSRETLTSPSRLQSTKNCLYVHNSQIINVTESYRSIKLLRCDFGIEQTFEANSFTLSRIESQKKYSKSSSPWGVAAYSRAICVLLTFLIKNAFGWRLQSFDETKPHDDSHNWNKIALRIWSMAERESQIVDLCAVFLAIHVDEIGKTILRISLFAMWDSIDLVRNEKFTKNVEK